MGIYSEVALACKPDLAHQIDKLFPWVQEEADEVLTNDQGSLYHFELIKWYPTCVGDIKTLCDWLKDHEGEYRIVEACSEYPDDSMSAGGWEDNPWCIRRIVNVHIHIGDA